MKKIRSLNEFIDIVNKIENKWKSSDNNNILYRGQSNFNWYLRPGIYRNYENYNEKSDLPEYMLKRFLTSAEINSLNGFIQKASFYNKDFKTFSKLEWYFLSQHYGLKTRLLDWTNSYLIALFFALEKAENGISPIIYILDPKWLNYQFHFIDSYSITAPYIANRDIPYGLFETIHPNLDKINLNLYDYLDFATRNFFFFPIVFRPTYHDERMYFQKSNFTLHGNIHNFFDILKNEGFKTTINKKLISEHLYTIFSHYLLDDKEKKEKNKIMELKKIIRINLQ